MDLSFFYDPVKSTKVHCTLIIFSKVLCLQKVITTDGQTGFEKAFFPNQEVMKRGHLLKKWT